MRNVQVSEMKTKLSGLLAAVEAGETVVIMRRGCRVAQLVPESPRMAADVFRPLWAERDEIDLVAPEDSSPKPVKPF